MYFYIIDLLSVFLFWLNFTETDRLMVAKQVLAGPGKRDGIKNFEIHKIFFI